MTVCLSVCIIALVVQQMQSASFLRSVILSSVACPALPYLPHYLISGTIFEEK